MRENIKKEVALLKSKGIEPCLKVIIVGENPSSVVYVKNKEKDAISEKEQAGIDAVENRKKRLTREEKQILEIKKKAAMERYKIDEAMWYVQGVKMAADIAAAVASNIGNPPVATAVGIAGVAQLAIHAGSKPTPPKLATGAVVRGTSNGTPVIVGENGASELILGGGEAGRPLRNAFAQDIARNINNNANFGGITVNSYGGESPQEMARKMVDAMTYAVNNRMIPTEVWSV